MNELKDQEMSSPFYSVAVDLQHGEGDSCTRQKNRLCGLRDMSDQFNYPAFFDLIMIQNGLITRSRTHGTFHFYIY